MRLLIIRHAEPELASGPDPPLTPRGREQAASLACALRGLQLDRVISSTMRRAVETAQPIAQALGVPFTRESALVEMDFGILWPWGQDEQEAWSRITARWHAGDYAACCPQGESLRDVLDRVQPLTAQLLAEPWRHGVAIVAHATVNGVLLPLLCPELRSRLGQYLGHSYTGIWELEGDPGDLRVIRRNDTAHLIG